jgi:hypothetical protein
MSLKLIFLHDLGPKVQNFKLIPSRHPNFSLKRGKLVLDSINALRAQWGYVTTKNLVTIGATPLMAHVDLVAWRFRSKSSGAIVSSVYSISSKNSIVIFVSFIGTSVLTLLLELNGALNSRAASRSLSIAL